MSLWSAFTGSGARRKAEDLRAYTNQQNQAGYTANMGYADRGYRSATGRLEPFAAQGQADQGVYRNALGLNGQAGRQSAMAMYEGSNPYLAGDVNRAQILGDRRAAATGQFGSGLNALARARVGAEMGTQDYNNWLNRVGALGQQGYGAAGALAGLDMQDAGTRIGIENALRSGNIGAMGQYTQQWNNANMAGLQNLMGLGGLAIQGINAFRGMGGKPGGANFFSPEQMRSMDGYF